MFSSALLVNSAMARFVAPAIQRRAAAMLVAPARRRAAMTVLRMTARVMGKVAVRAWEASSPKVTSRTFSRGEALSRRQTFRVCAAQKLMGQMVAITTGVVQVGSREFTWWGGRR